MNDPNPSTPTMTPAASLAPLDAPTTARLCGFVNDLHTAEAERPEDMLNGASKMLASLISPGASCWLLDAGHHPETGRWLPHNAGGSCAPGSLSRELFAHQLREGLPADDAKGPHLSHHGVPVSICMPRAFVFLNSDWQRSSYRDVCERAGVHDFARCVRPLRDTAPRRWLVAEVHGRDAAWRADDAMLAFFAALVDAFVRVYDHRFFRLDRVREALLARLSPAARPVLPLLAEGYTEPEIAKRVYRSVNTVHDHVKQIYRVLGVINRIELRDLWLGLDTPVPRVTPPTGA